MNWDLWNDSIVYTGPRARKGTMLELFDLRTQEVRELVNLAMEADVGLGLGVSPDGQWIIYSQNDARGSDIILVENFR